MFVPPNFASLAIFSDNDSQPHAGATITSLRRREILSVEHPIHRGTEQSQRAAQEGLHNILAERRAKLRRAAADNKHSGNTGSHAAAVGLVPRWPRRLHHR
jgi:hypothetical protein